jgi:hypothetical protein
MTITAISSSNSSHSQATFTESLIRPTAGRTFPSLQAQMQQCGADQKCASVQAREAGNEAVERAMNDTHLHHRICGLMPSQGNEAEKDRGSMKALTCKHVDVDNVKNLDDILIPNAISIADMYVLPWERVVDEHTGPCARSSRSNPTCWVDIEISPPVHAGLNQFDYFVKPLAWNAVIISDMHAVAD